MCTKTKTSFGCGHCVKTTEDCGVPHCQRLEKWKFPKAMDCGKCRASGETVTRGKDGRGTHGREQARHRESRQSSSDTYVHVTDNLSASHMAVSPWAPKTPELPQEKSWSTPTRLRADEAWLVEHDRRMSDLEGKVSKISLQSSRRQSRQASPRASYERVIEITELVDEPDEMDQSPTHSKITRLLPYEIEEATRTHSPLRQSRNASRDSEASVSYSHQMPRMSKTPRRKVHRPVPPLSEQNVYEYSDVPRKSRYQTPKTEQYYPQSCYFESPLARSPSGHGNWTDSYDNVQPLRRDPYYPRSYPVY